MKTIDDSQIIIFGDPKSNTRDHGGASPLLLSEPTGPSDQWDVFYDNFTIDGATNFKQNVMPDRIDTAADTSSNMFSFDNLMMKPYSESTDNFDLERVLSNTNHAYLPTNVPVQKQGGVSPNELVVLQRTQKTQDIIMKQLGDSFPQTAPSFSDNQLPLYTFNDFHDGIQIPERSPPKFYDGLCPSRSLPSVTLQPSPSGTTTPVTTEFTQPAIGSGANSSIIGLERNLHDGRSSNNFLFFNKNSRGYSTISLKRGQRQPITPPTSPDELSLVQQLRSDKPLMEVISKKHKRGSYRCAHCPRMFSTVLEYASHMDEYQIKRVYKCPFPLCPWKILGLPRRSDLRRHCAIQHKKELRSDLKKYLNLKDETYPVIECSNIYCPKTFYRRDAYNRHVSIVHDRADSRFNKRLQRLLLKCPKFPTEEEKIAYIKEQVNGKSKKTKKR